MIMHGGAYIHFQLLQLRRPAPLLLCLLGLLGLQLLLQLLHLLLSCCKLSLGLPQLLLQGCQAGLQG